MKTCRKFLAGAVTMLALALGMAGCQPNTNDPTEETGITYTAEELAYLKEQYSYLIGTSWEHEAEDKVYNVSNIIFAEDSVTLNNVQYSINLDTDLYYIKDAPDKIMNSGNWIGGIFTIRLNEKFYCIGAYAGDEQGSIPGLEYIKDIEKLLYVYSVYTDGEVKGDDMKLVSSSGGSSSGSESAVAGSYSFTGVTGSQANGKITLSDGTWSYSGSKSNPAASSGTYTVDGSKITMIWTLSEIKTSETFTVTTSGSSSTWKSDNAYTSTFFSGMFGVTGLEMTFTYAE